MICTNTTSQDYWFGPLHLPGGVGQTLTVDDTSATSLYLLDDQVADAINTLSLSGKITVSGQALPFPRPTGVPQLLHGDGAPEGLVFAPPGTLYMRRDSTGAASSLYTKTTGVTLNTGWQAIGATSLIPTLALASFPPPSPVDGQLVSLILPSTYDPVGGKQIRWLCEYDSAAAVWHVRGPALYAEVQTSETTTSATYAALTTAGPSITLPRPGDYLVQHGAFNNQNTASQENYMSYDIGATGAVDADAVESLISSFSVGSSVSRQRLKAGLSTVTLTAKYRVSTGGDTGTFSQRFMAVTPVRIT